MFKVGGGYELHHGRDLASDVAEFARVSAQARTLTTLVESDFPDIIESNGVFIDFFAPWCPPCLNLLPEYRRASINIGGNIVFGTVDCTEQKSVCDRFNVRSYPTTVFYNQSRPHYYHGEHSASALTDFVHEILNPSVVSLDYYSFYSLVGEKDDNEMWLVDFYAPCKKILNSAFNISVHVAMVRAHLHMANNLSTNTRLILDEEFFFAGDEFLTLILNNFNLFLRKIVHKP